MAPSYKAMECNGVALSSLTCPHTDLDGFMLVLHTTKIYRLLDLELFLLLTVKVYLHIYLLGSGKHNIHEKWCISVVQDH